jgi:hypothetical protein
MFCASEKTPGHQKAARRGGEKDEGIFQRIGLSGSMAWSAEYPFTACIIATQPYRKMTPRLPDGHQIFPFRTGRQAGQSFKLHFLSLNFHVISGAFWSFSSAVAGLAEVFMPGQTVIAILL